MFSSIHVLFLKTAPDMMLRILFWHFLFIAANIMGEKKQQELPNEN